MQQPDAGFYQNHRDDPDEWGEPVRPATPSRRLAVMISVRFSPDEAREVRQAATEASESVSNFVRSAALRRAQVLDAGAVAASVTSAFALVRTYTSGGPAMSPVSEGLFVMGYPDLAAAA